MVCGTDKVGCRHLQLRAAEVERAGDAVGEESSSA